MNPKASISVVMPLYNNAKDVQRALRSVCSQTVSDFEVLVINDGSTDGGDAVARMMYDSRIRVIDQNNKGVSAARNRGVVEAKGDMVAFLDADDEWKPDFLETIIRLDQNFKQCSVFATLYFYRDLDATLRTPILRKIPPGQWEGVLENYFRTAAYSDPPLWSSAIAVKKTALLSVGGFPEGILIGEDLLTWARLAMKFEIAYSKKQCAVFWLRAPLTGFPTRTPEIPDIVGEQLRELLAQVQADKKKDFLRYLSLWHRMRASMFVQLEDRANAMTEIQKMAGYSAVDPRVVVYFTAAATPKLIRKVVLRIFTFVRMLRRTFRTW
jgi:hypothetical protein